MNRKDGDLQLYGHWAQALSSDSMSQVPDTLPDSCTVYYMCIYVFISSPGVKNKAFGIFLSGNHCNKIRYIQAAIWQEGTDTWKKL